MKNKIYNINREEIIQYTIKCTVLNASPFLYLEGYTFHYDIENDMIVLDKMKKSLKKRKVVLPDLFDAIGPYVFNNNKLIEEIDAKNIKSLFSHAIVNCCNLKKINLLDCQIFQRESIQLCKNIVKVYFCDNIKSLGHDFMDSNKCEYIFKNVYELSPYSFELIKDLKLKIKHINYFTFILNCPCYIIVDKIDSLDIDKSLSVYASESHKKRRFLQYNGDKEELYKILGKNYYNSFTII